MEGVYGPGHNAFYTDQYGNLMITYHAQESLQSNLRCTGIHRVHFNIDGEPAFDLSSDRDLNKQYATVMTNIIVL